MENASKALIMAGSVLIALLIIGALILMFNNLSNYQNVGTENEKEAQVVEFNNQYETYNRKNVRGSDLCSLLNRAVDYNRRKSTVGTGKDQGQYLAYEPITITFNLQSSKGGKELLAAPDGRNRLLLQNQYTQSGNSNDFERGISATITPIENKYTVDILMKLTTSLTKIFIADSSSTQSKEEAVERFNKIVKSSQKVSGWNQIKEGSSIRNEIYTYYEFVQFKRAQFDCTNVEYNQQTGRMINMDFRFNGKFE